MKEYEIPFYCRKLFISTSYYKHEKTKIIWIAYQTIYSSTFSQKVTEKLKNWEIFRIL